MEVLEKAGRCTVCQHDSRVVIDECLASESLSIRDVSLQFGLTPASVHRHKQNHVTASIRKALAREDEAALERTHQHQDKLASRWMERLESTYERTVDGAERAAGDDKLWSQGAKFLAVAAKLIDTGLRADGVIGVRDGGPVTNIGQVVVIPMPNRSALDSQSSALDSKQRACIDIVTTNVTNDLELPALTPGEDEDE